MKLEELPKTIPIFPLSNFIMCLILYFDASDSFAVIAINLLISPDHCIASFKVSSVSSVVNDFDEIINSVSVFLRLEVFSINSIGSEPVSYTHLTLPTNREV